MEREKKGESFASHREKGEEKERRKEREMLHNTAHSCARSEAIGKAKRRAVATEWRVLSSINKTIGKL